MNDIVQAIIERNRLQRDEANNQHSRWVDAFINSESDEEYDGAIREILHAEMPGLHDEAGETGAADGISGSELPATELTGNIEEPTS